MLETGHLICLGFTVVQSISCVRLFETPWTAAHQASLFFTVSQSLLKLMSIESVMPSNHLILCRPFHLLPSNFPRIRVFSTELALHNFGASVSAFSPSSPYLGLISFSIDWFDLLAVQGTQESSPTPQFKSITFSAQPFLWSSFHICI